MTKASHPQPPFPKQPQEWPGEQAKMQPVPASDKPEYKAAGKLNGKVALITGADSGIGRATAVLFAKEGANIVVSYLNEHEDAEETKRLVEAEGRECLLVADDIQKKEVCTQLIEATLQKFGRIDVLINNAAYQKTFNSIEEITEEELDKTYRTNIYALIFLSQAAVPHMKQGSSIINTSSIQAYSPSSMLMPYASTKSAIINISKSMAQELVSKGIRVNSVAPGPVWTPLIPSTMPSENVENFGKQSWFGRPAQPTELAPLFVFLASDDASYVTGQVYGATGEGFP